MIKLSFIKSNERKYNIERCLSLIKTEIVTGIKEAKQVVVVPNCISAKNKSAVTSRDALDALLGFIKPFVKNQIILAAGTRTGETLEAFRVFGYLDLQEKYDFTIEDLNNDRYEEILLIDKNGNESKAQVAKTVLDCDYLISLSPPKTDDSTVYSGAIKNVATGALLRPGHGIKSKIAAKIGLSKNYKPFIQNDYKAANQNVKRLFEKLPIKLSVIDAFEAMEGDGPIEGEIVPCHWAIATTYPVAADCLAATLMGIKYEDVGYLSMLEKGEEEYFVAGDDWQKSIKKFKMHSKFEQMKNWQ